MLRTCNRLAIAGVVLLAFAMTSAVSLIGMAIAGRHAAIVVGVAAAVLFASLWFALPLLRRNAELRRG